MPSDIPALARDRVRLPADTVYLCGNSLGPLAGGVAAAMRQAVEIVWQDKIVRAWNEAGWHAAPARVGDRLARLIGAGAGEVIVADSTSVNLFKLLTVGLRLRPGRRVIIVEESDFPTDVYIADGVARTLGAEVRRIAPDGLDAALADDVAIVALSQVNYRTGRRRDIAAVTAQVQAGGALMLWDLCHSTGAIGVDLNAANADFAVGCGYKYLNGGPGAPAYLFAARRHHDAIDQPLTGWHGHAASFLFSPDYRPAPGIARFLCGTAPQLSLVALEAALAAFDGIDAATLERQAGALTDLFIGLYDRDLAPRGFGLVTPRAAAERGAQVSLTHPEGYAIMQALIAEAVVGDFRAPDVLRFGFAPLYVSGGDVAAAVARLVDIVDSGRYRDPGFARRKAVT
jgi:kynureninase